ncbi:Malate dehydrogenase protein [Haloplasma contractile SSD-17B]|uniref:Malate dehydrogenase protein n=1 Tax=Haloplasma contractile SSD-17B TaxID=1033810 RepID=F7PUG5_9MOLU|nr:malate dehydrogenase [Haloplasma contractile]ERJ11762.1 Malate dehydrogenase protein [Haloplasma contractile SSD-17B]
MSFKRRKVLIIGSGFTRATTAYMIAEKELADVVLVDIPDMEKPTQGNALDMLEASPVMRFDAGVKVIADYKDTEDSELVSITIDVAVGGFST